MFNFISTHVFEVTVTVVLILDFIGGIIAHNKFKALEKRFDDMDFKTRRIK